MAIVSSSLRFQSKFSFVKTSCFLLFALSSGFCFSQPQSEEARFISGLQRLAIAPDGLLSLRAALLFSVDYSQNELESIQKAFQQIGIDAVTYVDSERVLAGTDLQMVFTRQFTRRDIKFLIFIWKENDEYHISFLPFNPKTLWTKSSQPAWFLHSSNLQDLLFMIFHALASTQKRQSFLINDFPEMDANANLFSSNRNETQVPNIKSSKIAVPKMRDESTQKEWEQFLKDNFHVRYEMVEDTISENDLELKGFNYILRFIHARGSLAKEILGYELSKSESALASVTYSNGVLQLKTIPSETLVYKFYFKSLENSELYFGTKWDADITWQDALKNHLDAYRILGKIN
jgi:hypothetical protein